MKKRAYRRYKEIEYQRPRCAHCRSLEVLKDRGVQPNGDLYITCKRCGKKSKCVEAGG